MGWTSLANRAYQVSVGKYREKQILPGAIAKGVGMFADYIKNAKAEAKKLSGNLVDQAINSAGVPSSHTAELSGVVGDWKNKSYEYAKIEGNPLIGSEKKQQATDSRNQINQKAVNLNNDLKLLQQSAANALEQTKANVQLSNYSNAGAVGLQTDLVKIANGDWSSVNFKHPTTGEAGVFIQVGEDLEDANSFVSFKETVNKVGLPKGQATAEYGKITDIFAKAEKYKKENGEWDPAQRASLMQQLRSIISEKDVAGSLAYDFDLKDLGIENSFINQYFKDTLTDEEFDLAYGSGADLSEQGQAEFEQFADVRKEAFKSQDLTKPIISYYTKALDDFFDKSQGPVVETNADGTPKVYAFEKQDKLEKENNKLKFKKYLELLESGVVAENPQNKIKYKKEGDKYYIVNNQGSKIDDTTTLKPIPLTYQEATGVKLP